MNTRVLSGSFVILALVCFSLAVMSIQATAALERIAMITDLKGIVTINGEKVQLLQMLTVGQDVKGQAGARLTLSYCKDGSLYTLTGPFEARIAPGKPDLKDRDKPEKRETLKTLSGTMKPHFVEFARAGVGVVRDDRPIIPLHPAKSELIEETKPEFTWLRLKVYSYRSLVLNNYDLDKEVTVPIEEQTITSYPEFSAPPEAGDIWALCHAAYPHGKPPLEPGKWECTFKTQANNLDSRSSFSFLVAGPDETKQIKDIEEKAASLARANPGSTAPSMLLISGYLQAGAYHKALSKAKDLLDKDPHNPSLHTLLSQIYRKLNLEARAQEAEKNI
jgi:hypothetical protein